jgi:subtilase family serine protease
MTTKAKVNRSARAKFFRAELALAVAILAMPIVMIPAVARAQSTVRLPHSVPSSAAAIPNATAAAPSMPMELVVRLALRNTAALDQLKRDQQDPSSPSYHQWLTPQQFDARFGPTQADADAVAQWLRSSGFTVKKIDLAQHVVIADANADVVSRALDVAIVSNGTNFANTTEPAVPAALAPLIADIQGLNNTFAVKPMLSNHLEFGPPLREGQPDATASPDFKTSLGLGFSASDLRTYYDEAGLISGGITGTKAPDCIALAATSDLHNNSIGAFTSKFGLPAAHLTKVFASGGTPGFNSAEIEAALDVESSHAIAPSTPVRLYIGRGANDLQDAFSRAVTDNTCGTLSISFGYCGEPSSFFTGTLAPIFSQAAAQGQSVFVSSGDQGAAGIIPGTTSCVTGFSPNINELCANPDVTCVGGTEFNPTYDLKNRDTSTVHDALESAWNEVGVGGTGGGESVVFSRPSYQVGTGVPPGTMRLVPDVSMIASLRMPGFYIVAFFKGALRIVLVGGTSLSSPLWAGYSRIIAGVANKANLGPFNTTLYALGNMGSSSPLIDVISGDNSFNGVLGFSAGIGYDETTGWGSPDMTETLISFLDGGSVAATPASLSVPKNTVIMDAGDLTITNTSSSTLSVNSVTVAISRSTIFKSVSLSSGGQTVTPKKNKMMVFTFSPPISIAASGGMATFTLGATMTGLAQAGTPSSTQTVGAVGVNGTEAGQGVTFDGLPVSLGTITLTH